jgi:nucleotide-binding universal stress UspA family protein
MYRKVVVPLDGSKLAEQALLHLVDYAPDCSDVMLVSVTEKVSGDVWERAVFEPFVSEHEVLTPPPEFIVWQPGVVPASVDPIAKDTRMTHVTAGKMAKTAKDYLRRIAEILEELGFNVTTNVLLGDPVKEIVHFAEEQKADLILIASRGKLDLSRWNIENIAAKVHARSSVPVLLVKPELGFKETKHKRKGVAS